MSNSKNKQLLILAGLSCAGKSTLIEAIHSEQLNRDILQQLKINNLSVLPTFDDADLPQLALQEIEESIVLHYDLYYDYLHQNHHRQITQIIKQFEEVVILTIYVSQKTLLKRHKKRMNKTYIRFLRPLNYSKKIDLLKKQISKCQEYQDHSLIENIYQSWLSYAKNISKARVFVLDGSHNKQRLQALTTTRDCSYKLR